MTFQWPNILIVLLVFLMEMSVIFKTVKTLEDIVSLAFLFFPPDYISFSYPLSHFPSAHHFSLAFTFWDYTLSVWPRLLLWLQLLFHCWWILNLYKLLVHFLSKFWFTIKLPTGPHWQFLYIGNRNDDDDDNDIDGDNKSWGQTA